MERIRGTLIELGMPEVERAGPLILAVDQQRSHTDLVSSGVNPPECIDQEGAAQSLALFREIRAQAGQEDHGNRVTPRALTYPL